MTNVSVVIIGLSYLLWLCQSANKRNFQNQTKEMPNIAERMRQNEVHVFQVGPVPFVMESAGTLTFPSYEK